MRHLLVRPSAFFCLASSEKKHPLDLLLFPWESYTEQSGIVGETYVLFRWVQVNLK